VVVIGLPVALVLIALVSFYAFWSSYAPNRASGTIVFSGQARQYLLYVQELRSRQANAPRHQPRQAAAGMDGGAQQSDVGVLS
jgi:hypothetical protein